MKSPVELARDGRSKEAFEAILAPEVDSTNSLELVAAGRSKEAFEAVLAADEMGE